ncbi:MAG: helix-turn-helix transcriptional regulator [Clostridia bacterium]|nr:helix-turn-helix transcriptional regulator [Clostridia bacterium]
MSNYKFPFKMYAVSGEGRLINSAISESLMQIIEIMSGTVNVQIGTQLLKATAGDFLYIPPNSVYRVDAVSESASLRGINFDSSIIIDNMENFDEEIFYMFDVQSKNRVSLFKKGSPIYSTLSLYMSESYDEYVSKDICYKLPIRANIYRMVTALLRYYCGSKFDTDTDECEGNDPNETLFDDLPTASYAKENAKNIYHNVLRLAPVITFISEHYCEKIYVEKLADMITVSPDYFTKMFRDSIGKTPIDYINGLRVNRAMVLLFDTKMSMAEIADEVGFCNPNYFHKIFKQYMGVSPLAYRKSTV